MAKDYGSHMAEGSRKAWQKEACLWQKEGMVHAEHILVSWVEQAEHKLLYKRRGSDEGVGTYGQVVASRAALHTKTQSMHVQ